MDFSEKCGQEKSQVKYLTKTEQSLFIFVLTSDISVCVRNDNDQFRPLHNPMQERFICATIIIYDEDCNYEGTCTSNLVNSLIIIINNNKLNNDKFNISLCNG